MKRILKITSITFILYIVFQIKVFAAGSISPSPRSLIITEGGSGSFTITASNAAGRVNISSSNNAVASVSTSSVWVENGSSTIMITGKSAGSATITVSLYDAATFDEEVLTNSYTVNVKVNAKQEVTPPTNNNNTETTNNKPESTNNSQKNNAQTNNNISNSNKGQNNLSKNNEIGTLSIEGYELKNIGNKTYELTVNNTIKSVNIIGTAKDSKAKIAGIGTKELNIGENIFTITVIAESGTKNDYTVKVTRKNDISIDDLNDVLPNFNEKTVEVALREEDTNITQNVLSLIKENEKNVVLSKYNENGQIIYSWIIDGTKIKDLNEFKTIINYSIDEAIIEKINDITNYTDGFYINFEHSGILPEGTKIKIYVGDKFKEGKLINTYFYNEKTNQLENIENNIEVKDEYIEFEIKHCSTYFVTAANLNMSSITTNTNNKVFIFIALIEFIAIVILGYMCYKKK